MKRVIGGLLMGAVASVALAVSPVHAVVTDSASILDLDSSDFYAIPSPVPTGTGTGALDLVLFVNSNSENSTGSFNFDDANTDMPTGVTTTVNESYATSLGELRDYYTLNFPDGSGGSTVNNLILFVDINETGGPPNYVTVSAFDLVLDFSSPALDPANTDLSSANQNAIGGTYDGGLRIAQLTETVDLVQVNTGIGQPDRFLVTGFDPFASNFGSYALTDDTKLLFHWTGSNHDNGPEQIFLSGTFNQTDLCTVIGDCTPPPPPPPGAVIPEPGSAMLLGTGLLGLIGLRRKRS